MNLNIIGRKNIFLAVAVVMVAASLVAIAAFGFRQGIDFSGGTLWKMTVPGGNPAGLSAFLAENGVRDPKVNYDPASGSFLVRMPAADSETSHERLSGAFQAEYPGWEELSYQSIGPSVGRELRNKSLIAIVLVLVGISLYIAFAFRKVYRPLSSWTYGTMTLASLFHDVAIPAGLLAVLGRYRGIEIDSNFVVALLVVIGFSVHDTIVVFDRIRENLLLDRGRTGFGETVNTSINQTLARSINTSLTLVLVLLALYFVGPLTLRYFILTLLVGTVAGVYSSIFVASPLLYLWYARRAKTGS